MSKIESNSFVVEAKPFNLARTLVEVDDIVRIQAEQSGLQPVSYPLFEPPKPYLNS